jgi:uncharacterized protein YjdB
VTDSTAYLSGTSTEKTFKVTIPAKSTVSYEVTGWKVGVALKSTATSGEYVKSDILSLEEPAHDPEITKVTTSKTSVSSEGEEIIVTVEGYSLPDTAYYKIYYQRSYNNNVVDSAYDTSSIAYETGGTANKKTFKVQIPAESEVRNYTVLGWKVGVALSSNAISSEYIKSAAMSLKEPFDATKLAIKVVDQNDAAVNGIKLRMTSSDAEDIAITSSTTNGTVSYQCDDSESTEATYELQPVEGSGYLCESPVKIKFAKNEDNETYVASIDGVAYSEDAGIATLHVQKTEVTKVEVKEASVNKKGDTVHVTVTGTNLPETLYYRRSYVHSGGYTGTVDMDSIAVNATGGSSSSREIEIELPSIEKYPNALEWIVRVGTTSSNVVQATSNVAITGLEEITEVTTSEASNGGASVKVTGKKLPANAYYKYYYQYNGEEGVVEVPYTDTWTSVALSGTSTTEKTFNAAVPTASEKDGHTIIGWKISVSLSEDGAEAVTQANAIASAVVRELHVNVVDAEKKAVVSGLDIGMTCNSGCAPFYDTTDADGNVIWTIGWGNSIFTLEPGNEKGTALDYISQNPVKVEIRKDALGKSYVKAVNDTVFTGETVTLEVYKKATESTTTALQTLIDESNDLTEGTYTKETWEVYAAAVTAAKALSADATETEVQKALDNLKSAKAGLKKAEVANPTPTTPVVPTTPVTSTTVKVTKISISGIAKKIAAGKKIQLTATVSPSNASNKAVTWSTSNKKYATVSATGKVTVKAAGAGKTVTITAAAKDGSGVKQTYKITIMKDAVKSIKLSAAKTVKAGKSVTVKATVKTTGKKVNKTLKWTSSNTKYATVNSKGKVTAKKAGKGKTVKITAAATDGSGKKATVKIKIK